MSLLSWLLLLGLYVGNLFVGMVIFYNTECPQELEKQDEQNKADLLLSAKIERVRAHADAESRALLEEIIDEWSDRGFIMVDSSLGNSNATERVCKSWDMPNCFFFALTVVTTIGEFAVQRPVLTGPLQAMGPIMMELVRCRQF
jgi:hypothetical protein